MHECTDDAVYLVHVTLGSVCTKLLDRGSLVGPEIVTVSLQTLVTPAARGSVTVVQAERELFH